MGNLLDNANKFTDRGGQVPVRLSEDLSEKAALLIVSEFTVRLPLAKAPASLVKSNGLAVKATHCRRVLIIEDNSAAAQSLQKFLVKNCHTVELALSGSDGIEAAQPFQPEIVLCDIGLPGLDGYAVAQALHQEPKLKGGLLDRSEQLRTRRPSTAGLGSGV